MSKEVEFDIFMEYLNNYLRIYQNRFNTPQYYGIDDLLYQSEAHVIQKIGNKPEQSLIELAESTLRTKSSMSMMLRKLTNKGLVLRTRTDEDNRKYSITLTEKGKQVYEYHEKLDAVNYQAILSLMSKNKNVNEKNLKIASEIIQSLIESMLAHQYIEV